MGRNRELACTTAPIKDLLAIRHLRGAKRVVKKSGNNSIIHSYNNSLYSEIVATGCNRR